MARADDFRNLKEEAHNMYNERMNLIHRTKNEVSNLMAEFNARDKERAKEIADLRAAAQAYVAECTEGSKARAQDVANLMAEFNARDKERAKEIEDLRAAAQAYVAECTEGSKARAQEVQNLLGEFRKEREEAAAAWRDLLATMASARGTRPKMETAPGEVIPEMPKPKMKPAKAEKAKKEVAAPAEKEKKIFSIIKDNPEGITLPEIAYAMGVAFVTITKDVKKLLKEGKIKKKENKYFLS